MGVCPRCQQDITEDAVICPHCQHRLREGSGEPEPTPEDVRASAQLEAVEEMVPPAYQVRPGYYLKEGWELFKQNVAGFMGYTLAWLVVQLALSSLGSLGRVINFVVSVPLMGGLIVVAAKLRRLQPVVNNDFLGGFRYLLPLALYGIVSTLIVGLGFILLILPGVYLVVSYVFATLAIIDRKMDFWPAMEFSRKTVHRQWFGMFGFLMLLFLLNVCGAIALGVGLLVTLPVSIAAVVVAFDDILGLQAQSY